MEAPNTLPIRRVPDVGEIVVARPGVKDERWLREHNGEPKRMRVGSWLKSWTPPKRDPKLGAFRNHLAKILDESNREFRVGTKTTRLVFCTREDAEFIETQDGWTLPVADVEVVGAVGWDAETVEDHRRMALALVGEVVF